AARAAQLAETEEAELNNVENERPRDQAESWKNHIDMRKISPFGRTTICVTFVEQQSGLRQVVKDCDATRKM
ncbi:MAG: hypothetical protein ACTHMB_07235, partial [Candidatus Binatia bacterium]